jgi:hypothetical protein
MKVLILIALMVIVKFLHCFILSFRLMLYTLEIKINSNVKIQQIQQEIQQVHQQHSDMEIQQITQDVIVLIKKMVYTIAY